MTVIIYIVTGTFYCFDLLLCIGCNLVLCAAARVDRQGALARDFQSQCGIRG